MLKISSSVNLRLHYSPLQNALITPPSLKAICAEYVPLADRLYAYFKQSNPFSYDGTDNDDADAIDTILKNDYTTRHLKVDRNRLHISMEGWVYVDVANQPNRHPPSGTTHDEQSNYWLYGFGAISGVLTW